MKKGIALGFNQTGEISIDFSKTVSGFDSTIQNTIVNIATSENTDKIFPEKGTSLKERLIQGGMFRDNAKHLCNFAMIDAKNFTNETNSDTELITEAFLDCQTNKSGDGLDLKLEATSSEGNTSKFTWEL